jgi:hypothetical protein
MKKQTKLVAVLSTAALLAIGASMTSFAATGWAEEDGTWVYYDRNGDKVTDKWAKSGNNWYYLDNNGEMAIDTLIEDNQGFFRHDFLTACQHKVLQNPVHILGCFKKLLIFFIFIKVKVSCIFITASAELFQNPSLTHLTYALQD